MDDLTTGSDVRLWRLPDPAAWFEAVVTTRHGGTSEGPFASLNLGRHAGDDPERVAANRERLCRHLGLDAGRLHVLDQVHGTTFRERPADGGATGDGLWTREPGQVLVVSVADCVPIFLWDARRRYLGLVHAGWRGTAAGILGRALATLRAAGARPGDLHVALGPSIGPCCYRVHTDVASGFPAAALRERDGALFLDLRSANRLQALEQGLAAAAIQDAPPCTACDTDFFSYRRQGPRSGRQWALAWRR